jgi:hypothetical protein
MLQALRENSAKKTSDHNVSLILGAIRTTMITSESVVESILRSDNDFLATMVHALCFVTINERKDTLDVFSLALLVNRKFKFADVESQLANSFVFHDKLFKELLHELKEGIDIDFKVTRYLKHNSL